MRHLVNALLLPALIASIPARPLAAQEPEEARVANLIRQLNSPSYAQRRTASEALWKLGTASQPQLEAAATSADPEARLRAQDLLHRMHVEALWEARPIDLDCAQQPVAVVLSQLRELSGTQILAGERYGSFEDGRVTLNLSGGSFWQAIDEVCRQTNNHVRPHYNPRQPGLVLISGPAGENPVAYCGPVRAQLTAARRSFSEELDYDSLKSEVTHTFQLDLQLMWEDRFRLVAYRAGPELVAAVTTRGEQLPATQQASGSWNVAGPGIRQLTATLRLHPPSPRAERLKELHLAWELIAVGEMTTLDVEAPQPNMVRRQGDAELVIESIEERSQGTYTVSVVVHRDLLPPEPREALLHENELELFDAEGRAFNRHGESTSLADGAARMKVTFEAPHEDASPHTLRLHYPKVRSQRHREIKFHDVPLPVATPE